MAKSSSFDKKIEKVGKALYATSFVNDGWKTGWCRKNTTLQCYYNNYRYVLIKDLGQQHDEGSN